MPEIEVPGMAKAVEDRRREMKLTPGQFAAAAGLTAQGLVPVRKGYQRAYQDRVRLGVARALQWPADWYDRLQAGEPVEANPSGESDDDARLAAIERRLERIEQAVAQLAPPVVPEAR